MAADKQAVVSRIVAQTSALRRTRLPRAFVPSEGPPESMGRIGKPEDIAPIVVFLASSDSRWINGQVHYATGALI